MLGQVFAKNPKAYEIETSLQKKSKLVGKEHLIMMNSDGDEQGNCYKMSHIAHRNRSEIGWQVSNQRNGFHGEVPNTIGD